MLIYTCPECGHDLMTSVLTCNPPIQKYECTSCGWHHEEQTEPIRVPFPEIQPEVLRETTYTYASNYLHNACKGCSNNPANGGSGICYCILGSSVIV